ncbi:MAG: permease [Desulfobulbaceae bacterium]|nr:permease [Desulfobulbaceae bacterium]
MKQAFQQTIKVFKTILPMLCGVLLLVSLFHQLFKDNYQQWFSGNLILDPLIGTIAGSISFGMPITSYIAGGELLHSGVSLVAVTAFIMSWTTVGLVMIPIEAASLGRRFAIVRNLLNFVFALLVAIATVTTLEFLP